MSQAIKQILDEAGSLAAAEKALKVAGAEQVEVVIIRTGSQLTRFAQSAIHQNTSQADTRLSVRVVVDKKIGCAAANSLSDQALQWAGKQAMAIAKVQKPNEHFKSLPAPKSVKRLTETVDEFTAECGPEDRAEVVSRIVARAEKAGLKASGSLSTGVASITVANSLGVRAFHAGTSAEFVLIASADTSTGYADGNGLRFGSLDFEKAAEVAVQKCLDGKEPVGLEPGEYPVVLEEAAVADMLSFLSWGGFSATSVQEGTSFLCEKLGQKVASELVTLWDDGLDMRGDPLPFDFEGVPKQRVPLIERGVAVGCVYDSYTAGKEGKESTGHALPAPNTWGPIAMNMVMAPGEASRDEMIVGIDRGLLVTRFHYTNFVHPKLTVITGMTRDGTFLIEGGKVARGVKNLRFTQSILEALEKTSMVGRELSLEGRILVPRIKVDSFRFSGVTEF